MAVKRKAPAKKKPAPKRQVARTSTTTADQRPAAVNPSSGTTASGTAAGTPQGGNGTLDLAAMGTATDAGQTGTEATTTGGPGQEDAVYSTGPGMAPQLNYAQQTTYQETVAQQMGGAGEGTTTGGGPG